MLRDAAAQTESLKARQDASGLAVSALDSRMNQAEQRLNSLTGQVQEALAASAKEVFLANGREAFAVTLTEDKVLYPQNDPTLDYRDAAKLDELAAKLDKLGQEYHLDIQGHTTNNSTEDNNYNLGKARAEVVKRYLHDKRGISYSRMSTISYGANKPLDPAGGNNRRIFIRVLVLK
jgi:outer membrane protein OmpA-like peptidoglycan-associated protein